MSATRESFLRQTAFRAETPHCFPNLPLIGSTAFFPMGRASSAQ